MRLLLKVLLGSACLLACFAEQKAVVTNALGQTRDLLPVEVPAPKLNKDRFIIDLGEPAKRMRAGGGGRYLIFLLEKSAKLAVVDVSAAKLVHKVNLPNAEVHFAASREKLIVVSPAQNLMHRYSLKDFRREKTAPLSLKGNVLEAAMGCSSDGPLLLWPGGDTVYFDLDTLKPIAVRGKVLGGDPRYGYALRVSADGQVFMGWTTGISGQRFSAMRLFDKNVVVKGTPDTFSFNGRWAMPNANAGLYFRYKGGIYNHNLEAVAAERFDGWALVPTEDPRYFLAIRGHGKNGPSSVAICTTADYRMVYTIAGVEPMANNGLVSCHGHFEGEPRARFLPTANLFVTVPERNDRVVLRPFNLVKALEKTGEDYLFVNSAPKPFAPGRSRVYLPDRGRLQGRRRDLQARVGAAEPARV